MLPPTGKAAHGQVVFPLTQPAGWRVSRVSFPLCGCCFGRVETLVGALYCDACICACERRPNYCIWIYFLTPKPPNACCHHRACSWSRWGGKCSCRRCCRLSYPLTSSATVVVLCVLVVVTALFAMATLAVSSAKKIIELVCEQQANLLSTFVLSLKRWVEALGCSTR